MLLVVDLHARGAHRLGPGKAALSHESFGLPGIRLILDAVVAPRYDSIQGASLLGVVRPGAEAGPDGDLVLGGHAVFKPVEGVRRPTGREVVAVYGARDPS